jgi:hypothetical protein
VAAHALALWALVTLTGIYSAPHPTDVVPLVVSFFEPARPKPKGTTPLTVRPLLSTALTQETPVLVPPPSSTHIDLSKEGAEVAIRDAERIELEARQRAALAPKTSAAFAPAAPAKPEFRWDYARTHRVEPLGQGAVGIHLNDRCVVVLWIVPMVGCSLDEIPARGDLFDHMNDAPAFGEWKDR